MVIQSLVVLVNPQHIIPTNLSLFFSHHSPRPLHLLLQPPHLLNDNLMIIPLLQPTHHHHRNHAIAPFNKNRYSAPVNRILARRLLPQP